MSCCSVWEHTRAMAKFVNYIDGAILSCDHCSEPCLSILLNSDLRQKEMKISPDRIGLLRVCLVQHQVLPIIYESLTK